jgi:PAS domain S-box-containing protein
MPTSSMVILAVAAVVLGVAIGLWWSRRRAEGSDRERAAAEARFAGLLEILAEGVVVADAEGRVLRVNREFTKLFGFEPREVEGERLGDLLVPNDLRDESRRLSLKLTRGELVRLQTWRQSRTGERIPVAIAGGPVRVAGEVGTSVMTYRDLTEWREKETSLRENQRLLELFFAQSLDGFFFMMLDEPVEWNPTVDKRVVMDYVFTHQRMTKVNDAMAAQFGATKEELLGKTPAELFAHDPEEGKRVWTRFFDAGRLHTETDERRLDGRPMRVEGDYLCIYDERGRISGHFGIQRDITEQHRDREAVRRSRTELRNLTVRLQSVREEERREIAREIHDELGQALTGLKLDLSWLGTQLPAVPPDLKAQCQSILGRIDRTMDAVRRIATELRPSVLDQLGLAAAIEWQTQEFGQRTGIPTRLELLADGLAVPDPIASNVFRVLQEALTNITRHAQPTRVEVSLADVRGVLVLEVRDDGRGIPEVALDSPMSVGLIGMRERAFACAGKLDIKSAPGQGTTLVLRTPLGGGGSLA